MSTTIEMSGVGFNNDVPMNYNLISVKIKLKQMVMVQIIALCHTVWFVKYYYKQWKVMKTSNIIIQKRKPY